VIQKENAKALRIIAEMDPYQTFHPDWALGAQEKSGYLVSIGYPTLFPFDRYLVIGRTGADAYAGVLGGKAIRLPGDTYSINSRVSGFVVRKASTEEVEHWVGGAIISRQMQREIRKELDPQLTNMWDENYFALIIERPSFVRSLAILLAVLACISVVFVVVTSEPKQFFVSAVGSFLALWTVRNLLSAGAPKTQTLVDYGTLILFLLQFLGMLLKASFRRSPDIPRV
jgi:hypothetical protein